MAGLGAGLARGLESGLRIASDYRDREAQRERQQRLDAQAEARQARADQRQDEQSALAALTAQQAALAAEGSGLADADEAAQADLGQRLARVNKQKLGLLGRISSRDTQGSILGGEADFEAVSTGKVDASTLPPGALTRMWTVKTGRNPADFRRGADGAPSKVERAAQALMEAGGDHDQSVAPANELFQPELRRVIGQPARFGSGKIVDQKIIAVIPDEKNSTPEDPRVFLQTRVYVNGGKDFRGPRPDGSPDGATGHYDSFISTDRSSTSEAGPKSISLNEALKKVGAQIEAAKFINRSDVSAKLDEDEKTGAWSAREFMERQMAAATGGRAAKTTTKDTVIPRGGKLVRERYDTSGKPVGREIIEGNEVPAAAGKTGATQEKINAIRGLADGDDPVLTPDEAEASIKAFVKRTVTGTKAQGLSSGSGGSGGGGSGGGKGLSAGENRKLQRQQSSLDRDETSIERERKQVNDDYNAVLGKRPGDLATKEEKAAFERERTEALKTRNEALGELRSRQQRIDSKRKRIDEQLDLADDDAPAPTPAPAPSKGLNSGTAKPASSGKADFSGLWR